MADNNNGSSLRTEDLAASGDFDGAPLAITSVLGASTVGVVLLAVLLAVLTAVLLCGV